MQALHARASLGFVRPVRVYGLTRTSRVRALFLRGLGLVYFSAFTSLRAQVLGLVGRRGIAPARELLAAAHDALGSRSLHAYPSVFWFGVSDRALLRACRAGQGLSLVLVCGRAPRSTIFGLWLLYLSFVSVGGELLSYQWDTLLLETSVHALVVASPRSTRLFGREREDPSWQDLLLMRALAWRFFYEAGIAKLRSGDPAWRDLSACSYHYETQPLPTPLSWMAHRLPPRVQRVSTLATLGIECIAPFAAFAPRRFRRAGFVALASLQTAIALTGNYGFFNMLSIVLALWLLDDAALPRLRALERKDRAPRRAGTFERVVSTAGLIALLTADTGVHLLRYGTRKPPRALTRLVGWLLPLRSTGAYGLFSVMTRRRPEIVIEGSADGVRWLPYELPYKPGDPARRARWVAPHQPRLDWQMWFAAYDLPPDWFVRLVTRLLEGAPEVEALFEKCPFAGRRPRYIRAELYEYRMADRETVRRTGAHWTRRLLGDYLPPVALAARRRGSEGRGADRQPVDHIGIE